MEKGDDRKALEEYGSAENILPENLEIKYWVAVTLANNGKLDEALPKFQHVFERDKNWIELTNRIVKNGLLKVSENDLKKILSVGE